MGARHRARAGGRHPEGGRIAGEQERHAQLDLLRLPGTVVRRDLQAEGVGRRAIRNRSSGRLPHLVKGDGHRPCYGNQSVWGHPSLHFTNFINSPWGHGWNINIA